MVILMENVSNRDEFLRDRILKNIKNATSNCYVNQFPTELVYTRDEFNKRLLSKLVLKHYFFCKIVLKNRLLSKIS